MSVCVFFGHKECFGLDTDMLRKTVEQLIAQGADTFYVGNQGQFDAAVRSVLRQLQAVYPHIRYAVVLAYLPVEKCEAADMSDTMLPEGIEDGPRRFAIERRNRWLVSRADWVVCYVHHSWGGAYQFSRLAKNRGKRVINLCQTESAPL